MVSFNTEIKWNRSVVDRLRAAAKIHSVEVGVPDDEVYENGEKVMDVILRNEFGTLKVPPRPFVRNTISSKGRHWGRKIVTGTHRCFTEKDFGEMYADLGKAIIVSLGNSIDRMNAPPLAPATIARRRARGNNSAKPLIDTGRMKRSFAYRVGNDTEWSR